MSRSIDRESGHRYGGPVTDEPNRSHTYVRQNVSARESAASPITIAPAKADVPWFAVPGGHTEFQLLISNETTDAQALEVNVDHPQQWARAEPRRIDLLAGSRTTLAVQFTPPLDSEIVAGTHTVFVRVRDHDGIVLGEYARVFEVLQYHNVRIEAALCGASTRGGVMLRCMLTNAGNDDIEVTPLVEPQNTIYCAPSVVHVPYRGTASFDLEAMFCDDAPPDSVTVRVPYEGGEASVSIPLA